MWVVCVCVCVCVRVCVCVCVVTTRRRDAEGNLLREKGNEVYKQALKVQNAAARRRRLEEAKQLYKRCA